jgi:hypothetical protein
MISDADAIKTVEALSREGLRNLKLESRVHVLETMLREITDAVQGGMYKPDVLFGAISRARLWLQSDAEAKQ